MTALFVTYDMELRCRNGEDVEILRRLSADEVDEADVGRMYEVQFSDGYVTDAFEDELTLM